MRGDARVNDHPTPEELEGVAWNRVPAGRIREILLHVLNGCGDCKAALAPHLGGAARPRGAARSGPLPS